MLTLDVSSTISGPLFDGRALHAVDQACNDIERETAQYGAALIRTRMNATFKVQTPHYRPANQARRDGAHWKISDTGIIYGPWLEGVGSRNRTTRFKGYFNYRRSVGEIQRYMDRISNFSIDEHLRRVGAS